MTRKQLQERAARITDKAVNADDREALREVPVALHAVAKLCMRALLHYRKAELAAKRAEAEASLRDFGADKMTVPERKAAAQLTPAVVATQDLAVRWEVTHKYLQSCVDALAQRMSACKAQVEILKVEAAAALEPKPVKGRV